MRTIVAGVVSMTMICGGPVAAQTARPDPIEIPLRVEGGRLVVTAEGPDHTTYDFVLGLGVPLLTESGAKRIGADRSTLTLGGLPVLTEGAQTVPDKDLGMAAGGPIGVLGSETLNRYDMLIDAPNGRLVLKPSGRAVRWDGVALSNPVAVTVFHDMLIRADVQLAGTVYGGLLDLSVPALQVAEPLRRLVGGGRVDSFRMGYAGWPELPIEVVDSPVFGRWDPQGAGFVVIGAAVAYDCALAISFRHSEIRTCLR